jgi:hypothetical protein
LPGRDRLTAAAPAMAEVPWLLGLLQVLDDKQLLAATLIGDPSAGPIPGERPDRSWIAAATDAPDMAPRRRRPDGRSGRGVADDQAARVGVQAGRRLAVDGLEQQLGGRPAQSLQVHVDAG